MDIRITKSQRIYYQVPSDIGALLCEALPSVFECVNAAAPLNEHTPKPAVPKLPTFAVSRNRVGLSCIELALPSGEIQEFNGPPECATSAFAPHDVPKAVLERYANVYKKDQPSGAR